MSKHAFGRRGFLLSSSAAVAALNLVGCEGEAGEPDGSQKKKAQASKQQVRAPLAPKCSATPKAYVLGAASRVLESALQAGGFEVDALPLDQSPIDLQGLIVIPAFASEDAAYSTYMQTYAADLYAFVDDTNVLLQLAQAKEREEAPPFLPTTHVARRGDIAVSRVRAVHAKHALLENVSITEGMLDFEAEDLIVGAFESQDGFEVILADETAKYPVLMEGAYGQGRFLLSALSFDFASGAGAALEATFFSNLLGHVQSICAGGGAALEITNNQVTESFTKGSQMIAVMPDTQVYALRLPGLFHAQTSWIREHAEELDIRFALHLGDVTNNNTRREWQRAASAFELLRDVVPFAIAPGNHDYGPSGNASNRESKLGEFFSFEAQASTPGFGGSFEAGQLDNTYHLLSIGGRDLIVLALEWAPRDEVIAWANTIMAKHPDREGILATHAYLNNDDRRYDHTDTERSQRFNPHDYRTPGSLNDGEELWQKLVRRHRFIMTLNGHVLGSGVGYLASKTDHGNTCHQMLSNYQMRTQGGECYLRLLEFLPDGKHVRVFTYSPLFDKLLDDPKHNLELSLA